MTETRVCPRKSCSANGVPQPASEFTYRADVQSKLSSMCRACSRDKNRRDHERRTSGGLKIIRAQSGDPGDTAQQLLIARLRNEVVGFRQQVRDLERMVLTGENLRNILGTLGSPNVRSSPDWLRGASKSRSTTGTAVLVISDIHWSEVVQSDQIGGCNSYNTEIANSSLRNTFKNAIRLLKGHMSRPKYDGMVVPLLGDLLSGNIHEELVETNESPIRRSMMEIEEVLIEGLGGLADEFKKLHVPCVTGNHGRMHKKPRAKNRAVENYEWSIYHRLASYFRRDSRLTFDIPEGSDVSWPIYKQRYAATHGDQFRGGDGIGGIMVPIQRGVAKKQVRQQAIGEAFDVLMMGHWHQYVHMNRLIINGSVKGYDEYAYQQNYAFEPPQQALFVVHPEVGCTFRMPVLCRRPS